MNTVIIQMAKHCMTPTEQQCVFAHCHPLIKFIIRNGISPTRISYDLDLDHHLWQRGIFRKVHSSHRLL